MKTRLSFGLAAAVLLFIAIFVLAMFVPHYDPIRQTVSEIGEAGSPMRLPFTIALCSVAACLIVFAAGLRELARRTGCSALSAYFVAAMGISVAGVGICSYPNPLHNVFGLSETFGFVAPGILALTWGRRTPSPVVTFSWIFFALQMLTIAANLSTIDAHSTLWAVERPVYGLVQRSLFVTFGLWCAGVSVLLRRTAR